ncbi:uncharacterized protein LOC124808650 [Hydra vulgaris]|uniref:uncharacterized protein LOC124808650 n=1 Tax=Hydra vulgaris TaxID=6087 RepID=UPI001F5F0057|nr:uncharacterized protein LOC124808650 [Hydra vulgaris]
MQPVGRGRPSAPTAIVGVDEIIPEQVVLNENCRLTELSHNIREPLDALKWLAKRRIIKNNVECNNCQQPFSLNAYKDAADAFRWYCKGCKQRQSVREGSFFSKSRLPLQKLIYYIYVWSRNMPQKEIQHEAVELETNPSVIGGINADGTPIVIEIDESKFFHRKYHRGQWRPGRWVFGGIERVSRKCFLVEVPDRTAESLQNAILEFILPGSYIVSDGWASYAGIERLNDGIYFHAVVIHERHFVDPLDNEIHTQNIENLWMRAKCKLRQQFGTYKDLFTSHLHEFIWRQRFKEFPIFSAFLTCVSRQYPL